MAQLTRRDSRDAALVELQRLHAAILASRARRAAVIQAPSAEAMAARELMRRLQADELAAAEAPAEEAPRSRRAWWLALAAAAVVAAAWGAWTIGQRREIVTEAAPPSPTRSPSRAPAADRPIPADRAPVAPAPADPAAPARPLHVTLETLRPVWMRVRVDGARVVEREVPAGEHFAFEGDTTVVVRVGDGGGVRALVNGVDRGPLGKDGWPVTVPFTVAPADSPAPATPLSRPPG